MRGTRGRLFRLFACSLLTVVATAMLPPSGGIAAQAATTCAEAAGTTLANCGFETPGLSPGSFSYGAGGATWSFRGTSGISSNRSAFTSWQPAPDGAQVGFLQDTGSFAQMVYGFTSGSTYTLSFMAARRGNFGNPQDIEVLLDSQVLGKVMLLNTAYTAYSVTFTTTDGGHLLTFAALDSAGGDSTAFVDAIQLTADLPRQACDDAAGTSLSQCGFEAPALGTGFSSYTYAEFLGSTWTFSGSSGLAGNGSAFTSSQPAPDGTQVAFLQYTGSFQQSVSGFAADTDYVLTFRAAQRANVPSQQDFVVLLDGTPLATFKPSGSTYEVETVKFSTSAGAHVLGFAGLDSAGGDNTAFIDALDLTASLEPKATVLWFMGDTVLSAGRQGHLWAVLQDAKGTPIAGRTVSFDLGHSQACAAVTDAAGAATCYIDPVIEPAGSVGVWVSFAGDRVYLASAASWNVEVVHRTALAYTGAVTSDFDDAFGARAVLTDVSYGYATPLRGLPVAMSLAGRSCTFSTDSTGTAFCSLTPSVPAGSYTVSAVFGARYGFLGSTASAGFQVTQEETALRYTGAATAVSGSIQLSAVLTEDGSVPVPGRVVAFTLGPLTCTAVTSASGSAACTVATGSLALGPTPVTASFAGDGYYRPAQTGTQVLLYAFPASGVFVVGDRSTSGEVDFFDANWWKRNALSGGTPASDFKGFADSHGALAPGGNWTATPGGSSRPPATVPSYMGVAVTGTMTDANGVVTGNIERIVIVHVDHYVPTVGQSGSGGVVG